jgi:hypothetical protein
MTNNDEESDPLLIDIRIKETFGVETKFGVRSVVQKAWLRVDGMKRW